MSETEDFLQTPALLALEDGSLFWGISIGSDGITSGEVVFNTSMTGYQEILTDPSYCRQIITLTHPHIGNVGVNSGDEESIQVFASMVLTASIPWATLPGGDCTTVDLQLNSAS